MGPTAHHLADHFHAISVLLEFASSQLRAPSSRTRLQQQRQRRDQLLLAQPHIRLQSSQLQEPNEHTYHFFVHPQLCDRVNVTSSLTFMSTIYMYAVIDDLTNILCVCL